ncbi:TetR/AcrR family transcriptional regulator C-terminal domain-containing protein [Cellulomonas sp. URHB0016]
MDEQQDPDARRETEALRRDRVKAERVARREADRARKDTEKAARAAERDEARRRQDAERLERDLAKADDDIQRERAKAEQDLERERAKADQDMQRDLAKAEQDIQRDLAKAEQDTLRERERAEREQVKEAERRKAERERDARDAAREAGRALREAEKAARAAALAQQRAAREAENARRQALRAEQEGAHEGARAGAEPAAPLDLTRLPADIAVLWRTPEPARRGPRPSLTLEQIADAGIALADAEGIGAVSMARLAESLGFTTMSLYRYVASKDEVLALMTDRAGGRAPSVGPEVGGWRARLELLLGLSQPVVRAHPWMAQTSSVLHSLGPNRLTWMEAMLAALDDVPLSEAEKLQAVGALSGHLLEELRIVDALTERARETSSSEVAVTGDVIRMLAGADEHPALLRAVDAGAFDVSPVPADDETLGFGMVLLLDGIERLIERASSRPQATAEGTDAPGDDETTIVSDSAGTLAS